MEIKPGFRLRVVCGENVVVAEGKTNIDFNKIIRLNETAAVVWKAVQEKQFTIDDMVAALVAEYEVDNETAIKDCEALAASWADAGILVGTEAKPQEPQQPSQKQKEQSQKPNNKKSKKPVTVQSPDTYTEEPKAENKSLFGKICSSIKNIFK